ncbi:hypothetical protein I79_005871 [Cricetulus griseus]|uniref:Uncharacterized protein n=1 Tax=Cricetulus griseus TaxID=10029 RepID=G3H6B6_CRIGR|nr:hypothetical protein I79_005871 [Cricetulus griseus]
MHLLPLGLNHPRRSNSVLAGAGRGCLELRFIEPTCRGSFIQSFPLGWKGHRSTKKLAADILGPSPTLEDKLLHHIGTIYASEDWRDPFCPIFQGATESSQVPLGIGSNAPNPLGPWKWELKEGSREAVM